MKGKPFRQAIPAYYGIVQYQYGIGINNNIFIGLWYRTFSDVFPSVPDLDPVDPNSLAS
jgi:hypothetical protein